VRRLWFGETDEFNSDICHRNDGKGEHREGKNLEAVSVQLCGPVEAIGKCCANGVNDSEGILCTTVSGSANFS
jgi:hypothetical protein